MVDWYVTAGQRFQNTKKANQDEERQGESVRQSRSNALVNALPQIHAKSSLLGFQHRASVVPYTDLEAPAAHTKERYTQRKDMQNENDVTNSTATRSHRPPVKRADTGLARGVYNAKT
jgi:hypothetical protein